MFIVFEGVEGSGKSTQIQILAERLRQEQPERRVYLTKEPGGTALGDAVRSLLLYNNDVDINPLAEFFLYSASRAQLLADEVRPRLAAGDIVLCDRYYFSSLAYQGYGRGLDVGLLTHISREASQYTQADIVILCDLDPRVGLERVAARGQKDRLESADIGFHQRVRRGFLDLAAQHKNWLTVDAEQDVGRISEIIWEGYTNTFLNEN